MKKPRNKSDELYVQNNTMPLKKRGLEISQKWQSIESAEFENPGECVNFLMKHRLLVWYGDGLKGSTDVECSDLLIEEFRRFSLQSLKLAGVLDQLIEDIEREMVEILSIKGPVLAQSLFGDVGQRHFGDLDLVVRREDVHRVIELMEGQGYQMISPKPGLTEKQWDYYFRYKKDVGLVNREKGVFVELHVGVYRHELLRIEDEGMMWDDLEEVMIGGTPIKTMNKNNTFLYLLYHGGQHLYFRLFWLRDVAEAMKRWELDHQMVLEKSQAIGIDRMVGLGVLLANELFEVEIPEEYEEYLDQHKRILGKLKRMCLMKIFGPEHDTFIWKLRRYRYNLMLKAGLKYKWVTISSIYHRWYIKKFLGGH